MAAQNSQKVSDEQHYGYLASYYPLLSFKFPFESLFRSLNFALMDNSCREFLFLSDFFMVTGNAAVDLFNLVMGKSTQVALVSSTS